MSKPKKKKPPLLPACRTCNWSGRYYMTVTATDPLTGATYEADSQAFCTCPRGVWLKQLDRDRHASYIG